MKQVLFLGRGGQGAVTSAQVLAIAAFKDGKYSQAFPNFGVERMGAPVRSYARIDTKEITLREQVYEANYAIILDPTLVNQLTEKVTDLIIVNSNKKPSELGLKTDAKVKCVDITSIALKVIGKPFVNIAAIGAFSALTKEVSINAISEAIRQQIGHKGNIVENIDAIERF